MPMRSTPHSVYLPGLNNNNHGQPPSFQRGLPGITTQNVPIPLINSSQPDERENDYKITATLPVTYDQSFEEGIKDSGPHQLLFSCTPSARYGSYLGPRSSVPVEITNRTPMVIVKSLSRLNLFLSTERAKEVYNDTDSMDLRQDWRVLGSQVDERREGEPWRAFFVGMRTSIFHYWGVNGRQPRDRQHVWLLLVAVEEKASEPDWDRVLKSSSSPSSSSSLSSLNYGKSVLPSKKEMAKQFHEYMKEVCEAAETIGVPKGLAAWYHSVTEKANTTFDAAILKGIADKPDEAWATIKTMVVDFTMNVIRKAGGGGDEVEKKMEEDGGIKKLVGDLHTEFDNALDEIAAKTGIAKKTAAVDSSNNPKHSLLMAKIRGFMNSVKSKPVNTGKILMSKKRHWQLVPCTTETKRPPSFRNYIHGSHLGGYYYIGCRVSVLDGNARLAKEHKVSSTKGTFPVDNTLDCIEALKRLPRTEVHFGM